MPRSVPNYLSINPVTGEVGAVFAGGVDVQANAAIVQADRHIAWRETLPNGAMVAEIGGYKTGGRTGVTIATPDVFHSVAQIFVDSGTVPGEELVEAQASGFIATLIDGNGASSYMQNPNNGAAAARPFYIHCGLVNGGTGALIQGNSNLTWGRSSVGRYFVNFLTSGNYWGGMFQAFNTGTQLDVWCTTVSGTSITVAANTLAGAAFDASFAYMFVRDKAV